MSRFLKSAILALSLAAAGLSAATPAASAAGLEYRFGGGESSVIIRGHDRGSDWGHDRDRDGERRRDRDDRGGWGRDGARHHGQHLAQGFCDPARAIDKARSMGLRRARVADASRRTLTVDGFRRGRLVEITFGNVWSCPVADYR
ncbi:hypothetical protein DFR52_106210 [Hoeflea marina]|uniref:YpeB-like protein with protease inhibitory function n=1 Tax=Hoeflea marina TaxID=274592 RepID=A0A317PEZ8_9HYPH|nr:hypothetical protein [Hoeflea marina]PWV97686.1 hypothetical protein DFR52_106210 [Hoeflea marina]